jgi:hypothetical protein
VDNSQATDFTGTATISSTAITGLAPAVISYVPADLDSLEVYGGNSAGTYQVTGSPGVAPTCTWRPAATATSSSATTAW